MTVEAIVDRRVRRTRARLREALLELTLQKGYGAVTVQNVIDRADVGRATLYAHFRDKDDLLVSGFDELRQQLGEFVAQHPARDGLLAVFEHVGSNRPLWQALTGRRGGGAADVVTRRARHELDVLVRELLALLLATRGGMARGHGVPEAPRVPAPVIASCVVSALIGLLTWWLDDDAVFRTFTAADLHSYFMRLTQPAIRAAVGAR